MIALRRAWLLVLLLVLVPTLARAHPQSPVSVQLVELGGDAWAVTLRRPTLHAERVHVTTPTSCTATSSSSQRVGAEQVDTIAWQCDASLVGATIAIEGLAPLALGALAVVVPHGGPSTHAVLAPAQPSFVVAAAPSTADVLARHLQLGAEHMLGGLDHLLFVLALVLLATRLRALVATVTAFTLGHAATLCATALGVLAIPSAWSEVAIAATLVVVALQLLEGRGHPPLLAIVFGLVHGLGFAGALGELGLPDGARLPALLGFNLGIELAQLALVLLAWPLWHACARHAPRMPTIVGYAIGALGCMWILERTLGQ